MNGQNSHLDHAGVDGESQRINKGIFMNEEEIERISDLIAEKMFNKVKIIMIEELEKVYKGETRISSSVYSEIHLRIVESLSLNLIDILFSISSKNGRTKDDNRFIIINTLSVFASSILNAREAYLEKYNNHNRILN